MRFTSRFVIDNVWPILLLLLGYCVIVADSTSATTTTGVDKINPRVPIETAASDLMIQKFKKSEYAPVTAAVSAILKDNTETISSEGSDTLVIEMDQSPSNNVNNHSDEETKTISSRAEEDSMKTVDSITTIRSLLRVQQQEQGQHDQRNLQGGNYDDIDIESIEMGFIICFIFLLMLLFVCCICCCCSMMMGRGGGGPGGGGRCCSLWDCVAIACLWEMCCDNNQANPVEQCINGDYGMFT